jgi:hypothetical protein
MGPHHHPTSYREKPRARRRRPFVRRPRTRHCLLKGCEQHFRPAHALRRYCNPACREQARQWAEWKAQQTYRKTAKGKEKRNQQSRRYRDRRKARSTSGEEQVSDPARVIPKFFFADCCDRPGCYQGFLRQSRSPRQRFCSRLCRRALERVWERERRWRRQCRKMQSSHGVSPAHLHQAGPGRGR